MIVHQVIIVFLNESINQKSEIMNKLETKTTKILNSTLLDHMHINFNSIFVMYPTLGLEF